MKLRNKKTGEICELASIIQYWREEKDGGMGYCLITSLVDGGEQFVYNSLAEMMDEWEDYKPADPLIKDEKVRKAVRAWAEANLIKEAIYAERQDRSLCVLTDKGNNDSIGLVGWIPTLVDSETYTIVELCGEEEE